MIYWFLVWTMPIAIDSGAIDLLRNVKDIKLPLNLPSLSSEEVQHLAHIGLHEIKDPNKIEKDYEKYKNYKKPFSSVPASLDVGKTKSFESNRRMTTLTKPLRPQMRKIQKSTISTVPATRGNFIANSLLLTQSTPIKDSTAKVKRPYQPNKTNKNKFINTYLLHSFHRC